MVVWVGLWVAWIVVWGVRASLERCFRDFVGKVSRSTGMERRGKSGIADSEGFQGDIEVDSY